MDNVCFRELQGRAQVRSIRAVRTMEYVEKRAHSRKIFNQIVAFEVTIEESNKRINKRFMGLCLDISDGGLGLTTNSAFKKGDVLELFLPVNILDLTLPTFAEVMWSMPDDGHFRTGLRFLK